MGIRQVKQIKASCWFFIALVDEYTKDAESMNIFCIGPGSFLDVRKQEISGVFCRHLVCAP